MAYYLAFDGSGYLDVDIPAFATDTWSLKFEISAPDNGGVFRDYTILGKSSLIRNRIRAVDDGTNPANNEIEIRAEASTLVLPCPNHDFTKRTIFEIVSDPVASETRLYINGEFANKSLSVRRLDQTMNYIGNDRGTPSAPFNLYALNIEQNNVLTHNYSPTDSKFQGKLLELISGDHGTPQGFSNFNDALVEYFDWLTEDYEDYQGLRDYALTFDGVDDVVETNEHLGIDFNSDPFFVEIDGEYTSETGTFCAQMTTKTGTLREFQFYKTAGGGVSFIVGGRTVDTGYVVASGKLRLEVNPQTQNYELYHNGSLVAGAGYGALTNSEPAATFTIGARHDGTNSSYAFFGQFSIKYLQIGTLNGSFLRYYNCNQTADTAPVVPELINGQNGTIVGGATYEPIQTTSIVTCGTYPEADYSDFYQIETARGSLGDLLRVQLREYLDPSSWTYGYYFGDGSLNGNTIIEAEEGYEYKGDHDLTRADLAGFIIPTNTSTLVIKSGGASGIIWKNLVMGGVGTGGTFINCRVFNNENDSARTFYDSHISLNGGRFISGTWNAYNCIVAGRWTDNGLTGIFNAYGCLFRSADYLQNNVLNAYNCVFTGSEADIISGGGDNIGNTFDVDITNAFADTANGDYRINQTFADANLVGQGWSGSDVASWAYYEGGVDDGVDLTFSAATTSDSTIDGFILLQSDFSSATASDSIITVDAFLDAQFTSETTVSSEFDGYLTLSTEITSDTSSDGHFTSYVVVAATFTSETVSQANLSALTVLEAQLQPSNTVSGSVMDVETEFSASFNGVTLTQSTVDGVVRLIDEITSVTDSRFSMDSDARLMGSLQGGSTESTSVFDAVVRENGAFTSNTFSDSSFLAVVAGQSNSRLTIALESNIDTIRITSAIESTKFNSTIN